MSPYQKTIRPLAPRPADFRKWRRLIKAARAMAANPTGAAGDLRAAAATACKAVAPTRALLLSVCSPLIRLGEAFPGMNGEARRAAAVELARLADLLAPEVAISGPERDPDGPRPPAGPRPSAGALAVPAASEPDLFGFDASGEAERQPRRDVYG